VNNPRFRARHLFRPLTAMMAWTRRCIQQRRIDPGKAFWPNRMISNMAYGFRYFSLELQYDSFPSGHSMTIFCVAVVFCAITPMLTPLWLTLGRAGLALTRAMLTAHFFSDVLVRREHRPRCRARNISARLSATGARLVLTSLRSVRIKIALSSRHCEARAGTHQATVPVGPG